MSSRYSATAPVNLARDLAKYERMRAVPAEKRRETPLLLNAKAQRNAVAQGADVDFLQVPCYYSCTAHHVRRGGEELYGAQLSDLLHYLACALYSESRGLRNRHVKKRKLDFPKKNKKYKCRLWSLRK